MQKLSLIFDEALRRGIRPDERVPIGSQALELCSGLRPTAFGLKDYITISQPMTDSYVTSTLGETKAWPFPQLFRGNSITLLCFSDAVYEVNESTWTATELTFYDAADFESETLGAETITADGPWHFMDFYTTWMLFNGTTTIFGTAHFDKPLATSAVTITTGMAFKEGRAVFGGFDPANFYALADWPTYWATQDDNAPEQIAAQAAAMAGGAGSNWVWWSTIGGGDLLWLVSLELMTHNMFGGYPRPAGFLSSGGYTTDAPYWHELLARNEMGLRPLPWQGTVLHQRQLGDTAVCYGDGGISALVPHSSPASTLGVRQIQGIGTGVGIASRSAVGGGIDGHVFVDRGGELWRVSNALQAERIGHGEIFSDMLEEEIVVSHDPQRNEFYIADGTECFVLTETGLGKAPWIPTQVSFAEGGLVSFLIGSTVAAAQIRTVPFGSPTDKRRISEVTCVTVASKDTDATGWQVTIQYRFVKGGAWKTGATITTDARGVARTNVSGLEFRVQLDHADRTKADLDSLEVALMQDGKKSLGNVDI